MADWVLHHTNTVKVVWHLSSFTLDKDKFITKLNHYLHSVMFVTTLHSYRNFSFLYSMVDAFDPDYWKFPKYRKAEYIDVEQNSGEMLVIPSGWYHQVSQNSSHLFIYNFQLELLLLLLNFSHSVRINFYNHHPSAGLAQ